MRSGSTRADQAGQLRKKDGEPERPSMQITRAAYPVIGSLPRRKMHRSKKITRTTGARVTKLKSAKTFVQRDPRGPAPGPPRPPPGPPRSAPGPAPNTGFGFIGNRPS